MTNYQELRDNPRRFLAMTGYTAKEFDYLLPYFQIQFFEAVEKQTLDGKARKRRKYSSYKNSPLPTIADKLLFILIYLKQATTQDVMGELFGMSQPIANKWIHRLCPILNAALASLEVLPARNVEQLSLDPEYQSLYFHDGTERPINRPLDVDDQKTYYSGKKKQHTLKNNVVIDAACIVRFLTDTVFGKKHDKRLADEAGYTVPEGTVLYQDTGFQGFSIAGVTIIQPKKKPKGGELSCEEKQNNRLISSIRIRIEHAIGGVKRYRIVKDKIRNWKVGFRDAVMETCCGLHNLRLQFRPWHYQTPAI